MMLIFSDFLESHCQLSECFRFYHTGKYINWQAGDLLKSDFLKINDVKTLCKFLTKVLDAARHFLHS